MHVPLSPIRCLYRGVDLYGKKVGVVCGADRFTYGEFGERCERLAAGLLSEGVDPGDRVGYLSLNTHQLLEGYFGAPLAGAIVMPLNVRLTPSELTGILNHAEPRVLIYEPDFAPLVQHCAARAQACIELGRNREAYEELLWRGRIARPDSWLYDEAAIAELFYTSGSTGTPKGVMLSHRTLYMHAWRWPASSRDDNGVELHTIPLFHANGWGRAQTSTMMGIKQVMVRRFEPAAVFRLIQEERATEMSLVPTMANALLNAPGSSEVRPFEHAQIISGGAASSPD